MYNLNELEFVNGEIWANVFMVYSPTFFFFFFFGSISDCRSKVSRVLR